MSFLSDPRTQSFVSRLATGLQAGGAGLAGQPNVANAILQQQLAQQLDPNVRAAAAADPRFAASLGFPVQRIDVGTGPGQRPLAGFPEGQQFITRLPQLSAQAQAQEALANAQFQALTGGDASTRALAAGIPLSAEQVAERVRAVTGALPGGISGGPGGVRLSTINPQTGNVTLRGVPQRAGELTREQAEARVRELARLGQPAFAQDMGGGTFNVVRGPRPRAEPRGPGPAAVTNVALDATSLISKLRKSPELFLLPEQRDLYRSLQAAEAQTGSSALPPEEFVTNPDGSFRAEGLVEWEAFKAFSNIEQ